MNSATVKIRSSAPKGFIAFRDKSRVYFRCSHKINFNENELQCRFIIRADKFRLNPAKANHDHIHENIFLYTDKEINYKDFQKRLLVIASKSVIDLNMSIKAVSSEKYLDLIINSMKIGFDIANSETTIDIDKIRSILNRSSIRNAVIKQSQRNHSDRIEKLQHFYYVSIIIDRGTTYSKSSFDVYAANAGEHCCPILVNSYITENKSALTVKDVLVQSITEAQEIGLIPVSIVSDNDAALKKGIHEIIQSPE